MTLPRVMLAPMEGVLDATMRAVFTRIGGVDRTVTEFVRVTDQLLPKHVFFRYCPELANGSRTPSGIPVFVQLLGGNPTLLAENAHSVAELGAAGVDLNFGCPAPTVNRHDGGATILKTPERIFHIVSAVRKAVSIGVPVTAKVRLGFEHKDFAVEIAQAAAAGGAEYLTVHARTKIEMYQPPAHWQYIARMREAVKIPLIANGDIWSVEDFQRCQEVSGCDSFALGRGLISRPDLARQIHGKLNGNDVPAMTWPEIFQEFVSTTKHYVTISERLTVARAKQWNKYLGRNYPEALRLFEHLRLAQNWPDIQRSFEREESHHVHLDRLPLLCSRQTTIENQVHSL